MDRFLALVKSLILSPVTDVYRAVVAFLPNVALAAAILLVGWGAAILLRKLITKLLTALGFNVLCDKVGLTRILKRGGVTDSPSRILGLVVYWIIIFSMLIAVFEALQLSAASTFLIHVLSFIPSIVVSMVILALGLFLGRFLGNLVERSSQIADLPLHKILGAITRYGVIIVALFGILDYLKLSSTLLSGSFALVFIVVPVVVAIAALIGGRSMVASLIAGWALIRDLKQGDRISFDSIEGEIISIDFVTTKIRCSDGEIIVSNGELVGKAVKRIVGRPPADGAGGQRHRDAP